MNEQAEQLVLEYLAKVADTCHGVMRGDQRVDFVRRLRERIEQLRRGSEDPAVVRRVIAQFGSPENLVERERRRLAAEAAKEQAGEEAEAGHAKEADTRPLPAVGAAAPERASAAGRTVTSARTQPAKPPPGVVRSTRDARTILESRREGAGRSSWRRPRGRKSTPHPYAIERQRPGQVGTPETTPLAYDDAVDPLAPLGFGDPNTPAVTVSPEGSAAFRELLAKHRNEAAAMAMLALAAMLAQMRLPTVAIFPIPLIVWGVAAVMVLGCAGWTFRDRLIGVAAPVVTYLIGGVVIGATQRNDRITLDMRAYADAFGRMGSLLFLFGTAAAIGYLAWGLLRPPPLQPRQPPARRAVGVSRWR